MKELIDRIVPSLMTGFGKTFNPLLLNFINERNKLLVFYFHGLYKDLEEKNMNHVDPQNNFTIAEFNAFIEYFLAHRYQFISPADLSKPLDADRPYAMLTFDDGYFNNHLALERLEAYQVPATFFIATRYIEQNRSYWWDVVYKHRLKAGAPLAKIRAEQEHLKEHKIEFIDQYVEKEFGAGAIQPWSDIDRPFTPAELIDFANNPWVTIGNHTSNHSILTNCSADEVVQEIEVASQYLSHLLGWVPKTIAYPNGNYNDMILRVSKDLSFDAVFTTVMKKNTLPFAKDEMLNISRFLPEPLNIQEIGSFWRMGYIPDDWYHHFKQNLKNRLKS